MPDPTDPTDPSADVARRFREAATDSVEDVWLCVGGDSATIDRTLAVAQVESAFAPLRDEFAKLVEAMPKTADGVPIVFGMDVWFFDEEANEPADAKWVSRGDFVKSKVNGIYRSQFIDKSLYKGVAAIGVEAHWEGGNEDVWSTREAAMASMPDVDWSAFGEQEQPDAR